MKTKQDVENHMMRRSRSQVDSIAEWARRHRRIKAIAKSILTPMRHLRRSTYYMRDLTRDNFRAVRRGTFDVPIDLCVNWLGFSYGPEGWHHYREAVKEIASGSIPTSTSRDGILHRFYGAYTVDRVSFPPRDMFPMVEFKPPLGILPRGYGWGQRMQETDPNRYMNGKREIYGPVGPDVIASEYKRLAAQLEYTRRTGYRPRMRPGGFVSGYWLVKSDGSRRFFVVDGNHKLAILAHLGYTEVRATYRAPDVKYICESEVNSWLFVRSGECSVVDAVAYFDAYFQLNGMERAKAFGLDTAV